MALEGLFRKIGTATARDRDSILRRIVALHTPRDAVDDLALGALWFEHLHVAATGAEPPRDGGDAPWTTQVIEAIIKCSTDTQNDLCSKRTVGNFVEWCDTPIARKPGFPLRTGAGFWQNLTGVFWSVAPQAGNDVYLAVPHPASDLVLEAINHTVPAHDVLRQCTGLEVLARCYVLNLARVEHRACLHDIWSWWRRS